MHARRETKKSEPRGFVHWGWRLRIQDPEFHDGLVTYRYQVPYTGTADRASIQRAIRKHAPPIWFGEVFEPVVTKVDPAEGVVIVELTHSTREDRK